MNKFSIFCLVVALLCGWYGYSQQDALTTANQALGKAKADYEQLQASLTALQHQVEKQNAQVDALEQRGKQMLANGAKATQQATEREKVLQASIARLQTERAAGCSAGGIKAMILREVKPNAISNPAVNPGADASLHPGSGKTSAGNRGNQSAGGGALHNPGSTPTGAGASYQPRDSPG